MGGSGASQHRAGGPAAGAAAAAPESRGRPRLAAQPRPTSVHAGGRGAPGSEGRRRGCLWGRRRALGSAARAATPRPQLTRAEDAGSGGGATLQSAEQGPSGASARKPLRSSSPGCRLGSWFSEKRGELGKKAPFASAERVPGESEINEMSTSWRVKKSKTKEPAGWEMSTFELLISFSFA